ncbi:MAG: nicotinate-nucleotide--dimethylbenzimidazole phosphoribosyltransferase [Deltaproteobacteria bacterium]|nr:nicotinate-nucleotide--dimethylbenzimidazole phosphoribosyltransferase [Deltaproteobacteria bacterium]
MEAALSHLITQIKPVSPAWLARAKERLDSLTKPRGSLGRLEELAARYVGIREELLPPMNKKRVVVFAADHGVVAEGVSAYPPEVTYQMVYNFLQGGAAINVLARHVEAEVEVVDIGVNHDFADNIGLIRSKVAYGSRNLAQEPALSREEAVRAVWVGVERAEEAVSEGVDALAAGDMGIGNTTPATALAAVFTGRPVAAVTGRGTGIDDVALRRKVGVINRALSLHRPDPHDPLGALAAVGGLEIAGIAGLILAAAAARRPVLLDGLIATAGALVAARLAPAVIDYLIAAHRSVEPGHQIMLDTLGLSPLVNLQMHLGEGTGAVLGLGLLEAGVRVYREMATFNEAGVSEV